MRVVVEYFGFLRERRGAARDILELDPTSTVATALAHLSKAHGSLFVRLLPPDTAQPMLLVALGEQQATLDTPLFDGAELLLLPPISGG